MTCTVYLQAWCIHFPISAQIELVNILKFCYSFDYLKKKATYFTLGSNTFTTWQASANCELGPDGGCRQLQLKNLFRCTKMLINYSSYLLMQYKYHTSICLVWFQCPSKTEFFFLTTDLFIRHNFNNTRRVKFYLSLCQFVTPVFINVTDATCIRRSYQE